MNVNYKADRSERGQVLVIVAVGLLAMIAMVGLVVDGGYAWGEQRGTQNASDASAEAGAVVLAERLAGVTKSDADVWASVQATAVANGLPASGPAITPGVDCATGAPSTKLGVCGYYTDIAGNLLSGPVVVGGGSIPAGASGVAAFGRTSFETFLMKVVGISTVDVVTDATAVAGYVEEACPATSGCAVLPVTFPVSIVTCDGSGDAVLDANTYTKNTSTPYVIPLCKNNPGNVGWLDWTSPYGGKSELAASIEFPNNPAIPVPTWLQVAETGNVNSKPVEDALRTWDGKIVLIPQFDGTCKVAPAGSGLGECASPGGTGSNQWYHLPQFAAFQFCGGTPNWCTSYDHSAYVNGMNSICDTGNGATSCLVGRFIDFITNTTVTGNVGANSDTGLIGVQLIK